VTFYHVIYSFIIVVALTFYFIPTLIAVFRKHEKAVQIFLLNIFLGWTLVGWVVALIWSVKKEEKEEKEEKAPANDSEWFESELLAADRGLVTIQGVGNPALGMTRFQKCLNLVSFFLGELRVVAHLCFLMLAGLKGTESNAVCLSSPDGELHLRVESAVFDCRPASC